MSPDTHIALLKPLGCRSFWRVWPTLKTPYSSVIQNGIAIHCRRSISDGCSIIRSQTNARPDRYILGTAEDHLWCGSPDHCRSVPHSENTTTEDEVWGNDFLSLLVSVAADALFSFAKWLETDTTTTENRWALRRVIAVFISWMMADRTVKSYLDILLRKHATSKKF